MAKCIATAFLKEPIDPINLPEWKWLYAWYDDGTVWKSQQWREGLNGISSGGYIVDPPVEWNAEEFEPVTNHMLKPDMELPDDDIEANKYNYERPLVTEEDIDRWLGR